MYALTNIANLAKVCGKQISKKIRPHTICSGTSPRNPNIVIIAINIVVNNSH